MTVMDYYNRLIYLNTSPASQQQSFAMWTFGGLFVCMFQQTRQVLACGKQQQSHRPHGSLLRNNKHSVHTLKEYPAVILTGALHINAAQASPTDPDSLRLDRAPAAPGGRIWKLQVSELLQVSLIIPNFHLIVYSGMESKNYSRRQGPVLSTLRILTQSS